MSLVPPTLVDQDPSISLNTKRWLYEVFRWISRSLGETSSATDTTSGTEHDFVIPSWATKIIVQFDKVSLNAADSYLIQLGDSGGAETTGYSGSSSTMAAVTATTNYTNGIGIRIIASGADIVGRVEIEHVGENTWVASGVLARTSTANTAVTASIKTLSDALTLVRVTSNSGTAVFNAGSITVRYE